MIETGGTYKRDDLLRLFRDPMMDLPNARQDRETRFVTLEPDDEGNYLAVPVAAGEPGEAAADAAGEGAEDHRTIVFLDSDEITAG